MSNLSVGNSNSLGLEPYNAQFEDYDQDDAGQTSETQSFSETAPAANENTAEQSGGNFELYNPQLFGQEPLQPLPTEGYVDPLNQPANKQAQTVILGYAEALGIKNENGEVLRAADLATHQDLCTYAAQIEKTLGTEASTLYGDLNKTNSTSGFNYGLKALDISQTKNVTTESGIADSSTIEESDSTDSGSGSTSETLVTNNNSSTSYIGPTGSRVYESKINKDNLETFKSDGSSVTSGGVNQQACASSSQIRELFPDDCAKWDKP
jgi:hypothetical protein